MRAVVVEALEAGALGFATSKSPNHVGAGGKPVPSRAAEPDEVFEIARALADVGFGIIQITPGPGLFLEEFAAMAKELDRPVTWTALLSGPAAPAVRSNRRRDGRTRRRGVAAGRVPAARHAAQPGRPVPVRHAARVQRDSRPAARPRGASRRVCRPRVARNGTSRNERALEASVHDSHRASVDDPARSRRPHAGQQIADDRGVDATDLLFDLSLDEGLRTRFRIVLANDDEEEVGQLLQDGRTVLGLSDAGAHASQLCDACFSTHLLQHWVRETGTLTMEQAIWRLTGHAAQVFRPRVRRILPWVRGRCRGLRRRHRRRGGPRARIRPARGFRSPHRPKPRHRARVGERHPRPHGR